MDSAHAPLAIIASKVERLARRTCGTARMVIQLRASTLCRERASASNVTRAFTQSMTQPLARRTSVLVRTVLKLFRVPIASRMAQGNARSATPATTGSTTAQLARRTSVLARTVLKLRVSIASRMAQGSASSATQATT